MDLVKYKILRLLLPVLLLLGVMSCEEEEEVQTELSRMFMPTGDIKATGGETEVKLVWQAALYSDGQATYTVEVATDTLFQTPVVVTTTTDTSAVTLTDEQLQIKQRYYARVKTNALGNVPESKWVVSSRFSISGEQIFQPILSSEVKDKTATVRWRVVPGLTKITLTTAAGASTDVALTAAEVAAGEKKLSGLTPETMYTAEIFAGTKSKGITTFTTKPLSRFTVTLTPSDDLQAAITNAANNDVIGLEPGTYSSTTAFIIAGKHITIQSTSGSPANTKINFKEFTLKGTGAGIKISGIDLDGAPASADYLFNLVGAGSDAEAATFTSITLENSIARNTNNCAVRGNRAGNNAHKIDFIKFDNSILYNNGDSYTYFTLDKMEFNRLELTNSTFYNFGRAFIGWSTNITMANKPTVLIDHCTINSFGSSGRDRILLDANANPINFTMQNSIMANTPKPGATVGTALLRATGAGSDLSFRNNNTFKLENGASPSVAVTFPAAVTLSANKTIDLGWTAATTTFTLPANSELRTSSTTGGVIGDPRWAL